MSAKNEHRTQRLGSPLKAGNVNFGFRAGLKSAVPDIADNADYGQPYTSRITCPFNALTNGIFTRPKSGSRRFVNYRDCRTSSNIVFINLAALFKWNRHCLEVSRTDYVHDRLRGAC